MVEELADIVEELATVDRALLGDEMDDDVAAEETIVFVDDSTDRLLVTTLAGVAEAVEVTEITVVEKIAIGSYT